MAVGVGSNRGDRVGHLWRGLAGLRKLSCELRCSRVYETRAAGSATGGRSFLNLCCAGRTPLGPAGLLNRMRAVEEEVGRRRPAEPGAPRRLDLDLLLYDDRVIDRPGLQVPHPKMTGRPFVMIPLAEVAPRWLHPVEGRTVAEIAAEMSREGLRPYWPGERGAGHVDEVAGRADDASLPGEDRDPKPEGRP